jgi:hypothetical protein
LGREATRALARAGGCASARARSSGRPTTAARPVSDTLVRRMDALAAEIGQTDPDAPIMGEVNL